MPAAIDVTIPRECIYRRFEGQPGPCPRCGGTLQSQYAHYMVTTWRGKRAADSFFIGNDMGWFCARWQALNAIEALLRAYQAEAKGIQPPPRPQDPLAQEVYGSVAAICEWRLGRGTLWDKEGKPMETGPQPFTLDEMVACLKRIRKSINRWTQRGGRQGYLSFVSQFIV